ncbi:hypothetical protein NKI56_04690 [Mesorhizobium sp. M0622]|uniref:hypothetical protein n=1 Tax=unclassified Mesorhizobium TaxID=325217 RepID=UPI00333DC2C9
MIDAGIRLRPILACTALAVLLAAGAAQSAASFKETQTALPSDKRSAEQLFADAPDGVDPMVTGPVSTAFKQRQQNAGCDQAVWPKIPVVCYPD